MTPKLHFDILHADTHCVGGLIDALVQHLKNPEQAGKQLVKLTCFLDGSDAQYFRETTTQLLNGLTEKLGDKAPPMVTVGQPPLSAGTLALELTLFDADAEVQFKQLESIRYAVVTENQHKWLVLGIALHEQESIDFEQTVHNTFELAGLILTAEQLQFKHIVRQWNYIENITGTTRVNHGEFQFYQLFNDIRAAFYRKNHLIHDFPAATGIGCCSGGFVLELIALDNQTPVKTSSVKSPVQNNAYDYSQAMLVGDAILPAGKQAPLFERAKVIEDQHDGLVFISGTAAIYGEHSVEIPDAAEQTEITIDNMFELISTQNLQQNGIQKVVETLQPGYVRVYVKNPEHNEIVETVCKKRFPTAPLLLVHSDVCRPELLVEIEAAFHVHFQQC